MPGDTMTPRGISFRSLRASDIRLMHRWLSTPHVSQWWYDEGTSYKEIEEKYLPRIEGREAVKPFVILHEGKPIGYIQSYRISDEDDEEYASLVSLKNSAGVDLFIGETEFLHRGLGGQILRRFLPKHVFSDPEVEACVIGPEPENAAAIRSYEKAGLRFFKTIQVQGEPEPEYLMVLSRQELENGDHG